MYERRNLHSEVRDAETWNNIASKSSMFSHLIHVVCWTFRWKEEKNPSRARREMSARRPMARWIWSIRSRWVWKIQKKKWNNWKKIQIDVPIANRMAASAASFKPVECPEPTIEWFSIERQAPRDERGEKDEIVIATCLPSPHRDGPALAVQ